MPDNQQRRHTPGWLRAKWEYVSNNGLLVALIVFIISGAGGIVVALKRFNVWFWTDAHISWGGVLIWALLSLAALAVIQGLAVALRQAIHQLTRRIALEQQAKVPKPTPIATTEAIPDTFKLGAPIRRSALAALLAQYGSWISLDDLRRSIQTAPGVNMTVAAGAKLAREMDAAARAYIVKISNGSDYTLTPEGRDWMLDRLKDPKEAPQAPALTEQAHKFDPDSFELTPPRCRALVGLLQRVDARTTLHDLYQSVVEVGPFRDTRTTKATVQQDMEEAEQVGIVSIDRVSELTAYYRLTNPGRRWTLSKETELRAKAAVGMQRADRDF